MVGSPATGRKGGAGSARGNADAIILSVICIVGMLGFEGRVVVCSLGTDIGGRGGQQTPAVANEVSSPTLLFFSSSFSSLFFFSLNVSNDSTTSIFMSINVSGFTHTVSGMSSKAVSLSFIMHGGTGRSSALISLYCSVSQISSSQEKELASSWGIAKSLSIAESSMMMHEELGLGMGGCSILSRLQSCTCSGATPLGINRG